MMRLESILDSRRYEIRDCPRRWQISWKRRQFERLGLLQKELKPVQRCKRGLLPNLSGEIYPTRQSYRERGVSLSRENSVVCEQYQKSNLSIFETKGTQKNE